ncbi:helix-turn-helix transcriptional regulator [Rhodococcus triatomae]|nr:AraC-type DNA-binding domain-containing protein [Rhodococcus triatomae BKS 15-14]
MPREPTPHPQRTSLCPAGVPVSIRPLPGAERWARVRYWDLGCAVVLVDGAGTGVSVGRDRGAGTPRLTVAAVGPGDWSFSQYGYTVTAVRPEPTLILIDHTAPHDFRRRDVGTAVSITLDRAALGVSPADVRDAARHLRDDPALHDLVRRSLVDLVEVATQSPPVLADLVDPAVDLVRALILGAARRRPEDPRAELLSRIRRHVDANLGDPDLRPATVAAAHHISVRHLHSLWSTTGTTLGEHITAQRLERARKMLLDRRNRHLTILTVAQRHGFVDATHFTRRFREAYGVTPGRLRRAPSQRAP